MFLRIFCTLIRFLFVTSPTFAFPPWSLGAGGCLGGMIQERELHIYSHCSSERPLLLVKKSNFSLSTLDETMFANNTAAI